MLEGVICTDGFQSRGKNGWDRCPIVLMCRRENANIQITISLLYVFQKTFLVTSRVILLEFNRFDFCDSYVHHISEMF